MQKLITKHNWTTNNSNNNELNHNNNNILKGNEALITNIIACISVGDIVRSLLGPKSRDKLIVNQYGETVITNDGVTVLKSIKLEHPISRMMVELSSCMDDQNGDGTTSVVVLCSLLLRKSLQLLKGSVSGFNLSSGIHPIKIISGYLNASKIALKTITDLSMKFDIDTNEGRNILEQTCKTTLSSKLVSHTYPILSKLAVESILMARKSINQQQQKQTNKTLSTKTVNIISIPGGLVEQSIVTSSFAIKHSFLNFEPPRNQPIKLVFINFSFLQTKISSNYNVGIIGTDVESILKEEETSIKSIVVSLKRLGVSVVGMEEDLMDSSNRTTQLVLSLFTKAKISVLKPFSNSMIKQLSESLNIYSFSDPLQFKSNSSDIQSKLSTFKSIKQEKIDGETVIFFDPDDSLSQQLPTILLRGSTTMELEETERALHDSLCILRNLIRNPIVVPGGGAFEIESAIQIRKVCSSLGTIESMPMIVFAEALEEIAEVLCYNAGLDHLNMVMQLKNIHKNNPTNFSMGIDLITESICNMFERGVLETLSNKLSQISMATEIVISILKIDE
eukprot:gene8420-10339_t